MASRKSRPVVSPTPFTQEVLHLLNDDPIGTWYPRDDDLVNKIPPELLHKLPSFLQSVFTGRKRGKRDQQIIDNSLNRYNDSVRELINLFLEGKGEEAAALFNRRYAIPARVTMRGRGEGISVGIAPDIASMLSVQDPSRMIDLFVIPYAIFLTNFFLGPDTRRVKKCPECGRYFFDGTLNLSKLRCCRRCTNRAVARDARWKARQA